MPTNSIVVFHRTLAERAEQILQGGFKDGKGKYMTNRTWRGVWVSDRPFDSAGRRDEVLLQLSIPIEVFEKYEWVEPLNPYRESLIPAAILNACGRPTVVTEERQAEA